MTHIRKYWLGYLLLIIGIIWLIVWGTKRPPCNTGGTGLGTCPNNFQLVLSNLRTKGSVSNSVEGGCPPGKRWVPMEINCITTPCPQGVCV